MSTLRVPNFVCVHQFCSKYEDHENVRCGKRKHSFWNYPVRAIYLICVNRTPGPKRFSDSSQSKGVDLRFILNRAVLLKWQSKLLRNGLNIMCMKMEHIVFLDSEFFLPCAVCKLHDAFSLQATKSWYTNNLILTKN